MSTTLLPPSNDDDQKQDRGQDLKAKKEKVIQPVSSIFNTSEPDIPGASEDLLKELRAKTAKLAEKVGGHQKPNDTILELEKEKHNSPKEVDLSVENSDIDNRSDSEESDIKDDNTVNPAVTLIREKLSRVFNKEPDASEEAIESYQAGKHRSVHQQFMYDLTTSGKSLADIQTEWHNYYVNLPENAKHEVWNEFYENQRQTSHYAKTALSSPKAPQPETTKEVQKSHKTNKVKLEGDRRSTVEIKSQILDKINAGGKLKAVHHIKSLLFGLGLAAMVGLVLTFTFFNEVFIAPFISPSHSVSATPIIGAQSGPVGPEPKIIIPKINLEVPIVFDLTSVEEKVIQNALEDGVVHYATTPNPGEKGNVVIVGHSSNNILNSGKYKFAFVLLKRLEPEDTFFVQKDSVRYTYKVYKKEIVAPDTVSVLQTQERANTITLITCDPPGTSINRLIITAEQISPDPAKNTESTSSNIQTPDTDKLPSNAPSLWSRIWPF
jgi:sortase A